MAFCRVFRSFTLCALCIAGGAAESATVAKRQIDLQRLTKQLDEGTPYQRSQAAQLLQREGTGAAAAADSVVATTVAAVDARDWWLAELGIDTLSVIKPEALSGCIASIEKALGASGKVRHEAAHLAVSLGAAAAPLAPPLSALIGDKECGVDAVRALAVIGTGSSFVMPAMRSAAQSKDAEIVTAAIEGLERIGPAAKDSIFTLCGLLSRADVRLRTLSALSSFGHAAADAVPQVIEAQGKAPADQRPAFVRTLQRIETADIPPTATDATVTCREGGSVSCDLRVDDPDDLPAALSAVFTGASQHGKFTSDRLHVVYRAGWGFVGVEPVAWHPHDGRSDGKPATLNVTIEPDPVPASPTSFLVPVGQVELLTISFDKPLAKASAEIPANYTIDRGVKIDSAALSDDGLALTLRTSGLKLGAVYAFSMHGVADRANTPVVTEADAIAFTATPYVPGLTGRYFANTAMDGEPAETTIWTTIAVPGGPHPDRGNYSMRWTGFLEPAETAMYTLSVTCDDGGRLLLDGKPLIESWKGQPATEYTATIELKAHTLYPLVLEYFQGGGQQALTLAWSTATMPKQAIPESALRTLPLPNPAPAP